MEHVIKSQQRMTEGTVIYSLTCYGKQKQTTLYWGTNHSKNTVLFCEFVCTSILVVIKFMNLNTSSLGMMALILEAIYETIFENKYKNV